VKKRKSTMESSSPAESVATEDLSTTPKTDVELLSSIYKAMDGPGSTTMKYDLKSMNPDPLTLDDFLNLWDGVRETPGRIIVITSNHYHDLDPALIRPGRIDITYECKLVSHSILRDMYERFYESVIDETVLSDIKEYTWSPAEVMNLYMLHRNHPDRFIECLRQVKI
jgi:SpoVK/Ycf46/Vps4 family AAA+-type ATPase